ncbi:hypothetical protein RUM43_008027 [Polyplax serrata]|uniref:oxaloacetate tautomerase n=1 Tax=Polyplax serrata TaxID=468196 RepID=A0AAN8S874_POLSC
MAHSQLSEFVKIGKKIVGAGINYRSLIAARNIPMPTEPIIFLKCSSSYITEGQNIIVPKGFNIHQEVELGVIIGKNGKNIKENDALDYVGGYCLALDMTEADLMTKSRKEGLPWCLGKAFDTACPVSRFIPKSELPNPENIRIFSKVNNTMKQDSSTSDLHFTIQKLISFISQFMTLEEGDLILTGSPAGAGPVQPGDVIECGLGDILTMKFIVESDK